MDFWPSTYWDLSPACSEPLIVSCSLTGALPVTESFGLALAGYNNWLFWSDSSEAWTYEAGAWP